MSEVPVTTEQVHELIQQLATMTAAASITPEIVANIFERMRNLNDQERLKVIAVAEEYIEQIHNTGIEAEKVSYNGGTVAATLNATPSQMDSPSAPFDITDVNGCVIVRFKDGEIQTKYFNSKNAAGQADTPAHFDIADENGCVIARFQNGDVKTKNFNSADAPSQMLTPVHFDIADENGCVILRIENGHIKTKNFDSSTGGGGGSLSHELKGLKVLIVGDSITVGQGLTDPTTQRWGNQLAAKYNWNLTLDAQGGIPLASNASNRNCIVKKLETNLNTMQSAPPDLVIIWGGHNDRSYQATPFGDFSASDKTNWCGCLRYCAEKCHQYAPNAKIFILTMLHGGTYDPMAAMALTPEKTVSDMAGAIFDAGRMFGMEVVDMSLCGINEVTGDSGKMTSDNTHPNLLGTKQIVEFLSRQLELRYVKYKTV